MKLVHVADRLFNTPLMVTEKKLQTILHAIGPRFDLNIDLPALAAATGAEPQGRGRYLVENGTAIIPIHGTLVHRAGAMDALSGLTAYQRIGEQFLAAIDDPAVKDVALDIDSCGGEVNGVFDLADRIFQCRSRKPVTAIINESAFSAAYLLASSASKILIPRTGGAGSVGVIATHADFSRAEEKAGVTVTHIYAGARKADFSQHRPLSKDAAGRLQGMVDETFKLLVDTVARNRNMSAEAVRKLEAGIFTGAGAIRAGLADHLVSIGGSLSAIARGAQRVESPAATHAAEAMPGKTFEDIHQKAFANINRCHEKTAASGSPEQEAEKPADPGPAKSLEDIHQRVYGGAQ